MSSARLLVASRDAACRTSVNQRMRKVVSATALAVTAVLAAPSFAEAQSAAGDHVVPIELSQARLLEASAPRADNLASTDGSIRSRMGSAALARIELGARRASSAAAALC